MQISELTVTPDSVPELCYEGKPVVTTDILSVLYDTFTVRIRQNYSRNQERFEEGKHFFKLVGPELQAFKSEVSQRYSAKIPSSVNALMLWTERGAARHAKLLDTDRAWDVFEKLEDNYFNPKESTSNIIVLDPTKNQPEVLQLAADQAKKIKEQQKQIEKARPKVEFYDQVANAKGTYSNNEAAKLLNLGYGGKILCAKLREMGIYDKHNVAYQTYQDRKYFKPVTKDIKKGKETVTVSRITNKGLQWLQKKFKLKVA